MANSHRVLSLLWNHTSQDGKSILHIQQPFNKKEGKGFVNKSSVLVTINFTSQKVKDRFLILGVSCLVAIDLIILVTYCIAGGNLNAQGVFQGEKIDEVRKFLYT